MQLCSVCGSEAKNKCRICGRYVCEKHYVVEKKVCSYCYISLCEVCGGLLAIASCPICGRLVCDECSVEITKAIRVCKDCYRRLAMLKDRKWPPRLLLEIEKNRVEKIASLTLSVLRDSTSR